MNKKALRLLAEHIAYTVAYDSNREWCIDMVCTVGKKLDVKFDTQVFRDMVMELQRIKMSR